MSRRPVRRRSIQNRVLVAIVLAVAAGLLSFGGLSQRLFHGYQLQFTDALFPSGLTDKRVKVVGVDSKSITEVGRPWPWPRRIQADLVKKLTRLGARAIVFDIVFDPGTPDDGKLAKAAKDSGRVLVATEPLFRFGGRFLMLKTLTAPVPVIARAVEATGHAGVLPDPGDGVVRSVPLLVEDRHGELVPALSLAALVESERLEPVFTIRPKGIQVGDRFITTDNHLVLDVNFAPEIDMGAKGAPIFSAVDVLKGRVAEKDIRGGIVFIGVTDQTLGDNKPTPVVKGLGMPGVLVHANALNTMLTGRYLVPSTTTAIAVTVAVLALLVGLLTLFTAVWLAPIGLLIVLGGYAFVTTVQFDTGRVLDLLYPMSFAFLSFVAALGVRYFTELRGRRRASMLFSQYVPKSVAYQLLEEGRVDEVLRGERVEITTLFCDLRGFTATSAQLQPGEVRDLLEVYYDETSRLVHENGGAIIDFIGDEVFAVWGAPIPDPIGPRRAVACARAFQDSCAKINDRLADAELPAITYGIGLHTGEVVAAHVGTEIRRVYTVLGDTVNVGSRLCTIAGRNEIVVSEETYGRLDPQPPAEVLPGIRLKGVGRELLPHRLWPEELRDPTGEARGKVEA